MASETIKALLMIALFGVLEAALHGPRMGNLKNPDASAPPSPELAAPARASRGRFRCCAVARYAARPVSLRLSLRRRDRAFAS
jgi:hypothetical protein